MSTATRPHHTILIAAAAVYVVAAYVPFGPQILYPLTLFTTWVHEMGHGVTALAVGGSFDQLAIYSDASGLASCGAGPGWTSALVSLGGLLAPPIVGALILATVHGPRRARIALAALAVGIAVSAVIYVRSTTGIIAMPAVAVALGWAAWQGGDWLPVLAQALGVILSLDTATRMVSYVFMGEVTVGGEVRRSDIGNVADNLGGAYWMWGAVVTAVALGMLAAALWWAWRPRPSA